VPGRDVDNARQRVAAVQHAVRAAQHLDPFDASRRQIGKVEGAADVVGRHAVNQHLGEVGGAAADEHRRRAAARAGLDDRRTGNRAQRLEQVGVAERAE